MESIKNPLVDAYIAEFSGLTRKRLEEIRAFILDEIPMVEETISYKMPAYKYKGKILVYFAGYAKHIGFYATPTGHSEFKDELAVYKQGKGSVQFPLDQPLPESLIRRIVQFRKASYE